MYLKSFKFFKFFAKYFEYSNDRHLCISVSKSTAWVKLIPCITFETNVFQPSMYRCRARVLISIGYLHLTVYIQIYLN